MNTRRQLLLGALLALPCSIALAQNLPPGKLYTPGPFDSLSFNGSAQVRFKQGERDEVYIEGDDEVQRSVEMLLKDGELSLRSSGSWMFWRKASRLRLHVTARQLKDLHVSGAANFVAEQPVQAEKLTIGISGSALVRFDQLQAETLRFAVSGSGDGVFSGQVQNLSLSISGRSDFGAENLLTQQAKVSISGLGKARLWVRQELAINISGIGTVDYWGNPAVQRRLSGISTVNVRGDKGAPTALPAPASLPSPPSPLSPLSPPSPPSSSSHK